MELTDEVIEDFMQAKGSRVTGGGGGGGNGSQRDCDGRNSIMFGKFRRDRNKSGFN